MAEGTTTTTRRRLLAGIIAAPVAGLVAGTITAGPASAATRDLTRFNRRVARYYRAVQADRHDCEHGELRRVYDAHDAGTITTSEMMAGEEVHHRRYSRPRWRSAELVYATPAPTLVALVGKIEVVESECDEGHAMPYLIADIRRLAGQEG